MELSLKRCAPTWGLLAWIALALLVPALGAQEPPAQRTSANHSLHATFAGDGTYRLAFSGVSWRLEGKLAEPAASIHKSSGKDAIGTYEALSATYSGGARTAEIRVYHSLPIALLRDKWNTAGANEHPFPTFFHLPELMKFSYQERVFGIYELGTLGPEGPWSLFDKDGNVLLLSPADHFQVSQMMQFAEGGADSRIVSQIHEVPADFSHGTLIAFGNGMNRTFETWGNALLALGGKQRPPNDANVLLEKLGYWTDRGAKYYYKFEPQMGYAGTLLAVQNEFQKLGVQLGYMQLDSWFYPKGVKGRWDSVSGLLADGEYLYSADKELFPAGLPAFQHSLGLPMATHARWISTASPYRQQYKMSANVIVDPNFWKSTAEYLAGAGVVTYEQDWINHNAQPEMNLQDPEAFFGNMSRAMQSKGITIQYCMPLPSNYMGSTQYANVQTIRPSEDRFERERWDSFLYDSRLASAVGLWPWTDVFFSNELANLILSTLSAGPVGVGDALGETNVQHLMSVIRRDGVIIKPDTPILPVDATYASDATSPGGPMVAMAESKFGKQTVRYVFAYPRNASETSVTVPLGNLEVSGPVFAYDWVRHTAELIPANGNLQAKFENGWAYYILSPVNRGGLALLGETEKIASMGKQRVAALEDRGALVVATVKFAPGEDAVTISGYAAHRPKAKATKGTLKNFSYDRDNKIFQAQLGPARSAEAILTVSGR